MKKAGIFIVILALCVLLTACGEQKAYDEACALFENGRYAEAIEMFRALGEFSDCPDRIKIAETRLEQTSVWRSGDDSAAERALRYKDAFTFIETGRTREAYETFASLGSYRDAAAQLDRFTVLKSALVSEETRVVSGENNVLLGTASYTYGPDGRAVSRSGYCMLEKYGFSENFSYHYTYDDAGNVSRLDAVNDPGTLSFSVEYEYDGNGHPVRELYSDNSGVTHEYATAYIYHDATEDSEPYTEVVENEIFNGNAYPLMTRQESYGPFGVSNVKCSDATVVNHYGADGRMTDSVRIDADGSRTVTTYSYDDVYIYTPAA